MAGINVNELPAPTMLRVLESMIVDDVMTSDVSRVKARESVRDHIREHANVAQLLDWQRKGRDGRDQWGADTHQQRGHASAVSIAGGPAAPLPQD